MTKEEKVPTEEERENARTAAKASLAGKIGDLGVAYLVKKDLPYGKLGNNAVHNYLYAPARDSEEGKAFMNHLWQRDDEDDPYSEQISGNRIIKEASKIFTASISALKVEDFYELMGSEVAVRKDYQGKYIADLLKSEDKEVKKFATTLLSMYQTYKVQEGVEKAIGESKKATKTMLEEIVKEPETKDSE